jgi:hypothetical protein
MSYSHACIKCNGVYQDSDPEPYYCSTCNEQRKAIAQEVDAKLANRPRKVLKSDYQIAQEMGQRRGESIFVKASDLGINF